MNQMNISYSSSSYEKFQAHEKETLEKYLLEKKVSVNDYSEMKGVDSSFFYCENMTEYILEKMETDSVFVCFDIRKGIPAAILTLNFPMYSTMNISALCTNQKYNEVYQGAASILLDLLIEYVDRRAEVDEKYHISLDSNREAQPYYYRKNFDFVDSSSSIMVYKGKGRRRRGGRRRSTRGLKSVFKFLEQLK